jgi:hypothetical protein
MVPLHDQHRLFHPTCYLLPWTLLPGLRLPSLSPTGSAMPQEQGEFLWDHTPVAAHLCIWHQAPRVTGPANKVHGNARENCSRLGPCGSTAMQTKQWLEAQAAHGGCNHSHRCRVGCLMPEGHHVPMHVCLVQLHETSNSTPQHSLLVTVKRHGHTLTSHSQPHPRQVHTKPPCITHISAMDAVYGLGS